MDAHSQKFVNSLTALSGRLQVVYREITNEWQPDEPPITTLFAALGDQIAEDFDSTRMDINRQIFFLIENSMESGNMPLVTAVATGLIEAMVVRAVQDKYLWNRISPLLGVLTLHHANAWLAP